MAHPEGLAQLGQLLGVRRSHHGAHETVSTLAALWLGPLQDAIGHVSVNWLPFRDQVLEFAGGAVARANQHEYAFLFACGDLDKWNDSVASEIGINGERIGLPGASNASPIATLPR